MNYLKLKVLFFKKINNNKKAGNGHTMLHEPNMGPMDS